MLNQKKFFILRQLGLDKNKQIWYNGLTSNILSYLGLKHHKPKEVEINMTFSDYRKAAGFSTQEQLALSLGIKRSAVTKWETGRTYPKTLMLPKVAKTLNITEGEIIIAIKSEKNIPLPNAT